MESKGRNSGFNKIKAIRDKYVEARQVIVKATALQVTAALAGQALELARGSKDLEQCRLTARILSAAEPKQKCEDADLKVLEISLNDVREKAVKAVATAATKREELIKAVDEKNILVTRWDQRSELTFLGKLAEFFSINVSRKQDMGGVLIAGDLMIRSVKIGEDYVDMVREMDPTANLLFPNVEIDLFLIYAKHREYVVELKLEDAVAASLSLTVEQLRNLKSVLNADERLELRLGAAMLTDISNIGALSDPRHEVRRRCFIPPEENEKARQREILLAKGYHLVYEVRGQMTRLDELKKIETDLSRKLVGMNDKVTREATIKAYDACTKAGIPRVSR